MSYADGAMYERYYRLLELRDDPEVGAEVARLMTAEAKLDELGREIMKPDRLAGLAAAKKYLKENPR